MKKKTVILDDNIPDRLTSEHAGANAMRNVPTQTAPLKNLVRNGSKGSVPSSSKLLTAVTPCERAQTQLSKR